MLHRIFKTISSNFGRIGQKSKKSKLEIEVFLRLRELQFLKSGEILKEIEFFSYF